MPPATTAPSDDPAPNPSGGSLRAWLELARISNLPTVWTNALVGFMTGLATVGPGAPDLGVESLARAIAPSLELGRSARVGIAFALVVLGASAIYTAGMILNDVFDRAIDARERPSRPLPSGRVSLRAARAAGWGLLLGGVACCALASVGAGVFAAVLALVVVAYDLLHARTAFSVALMGGCRGLVYVVAGIAAASASGGLVPAVPLALIGGIVALHTIGFSMVARDEVAAPDAAAPIACPDCDHDLAPGQDRCPECGREYGSPEGVRLAVRAERLRRRATTWIPFSLPLLVPSTLVCLVGLSTIIDRLRDGTPPDPDLPMTASAVGAVTTLGMSALLVVHLLATWIGVLRHPLRVGPFVLRSIAAFSLFDATILALRGELVAMSAAIACLLLVRFAHRRIAGT